MVGFGRPQDQTNQNKSLRGSSGRKPGGQPRHEGSHLKMVANPDVIDRRIPTYCNGCGNDLSDTAAELVGKRQVIDIPPIVPVATSWQSGEMKRSEFVHARNIMA